MRKPRAPAASSRVILTALAACAACGQRPSQPTHVAPTLLHSAPAAMARAACTEPGVDPPRKTLPRLQPDILVVALQPTTAQTGVRGHVTLTQRAGGVQVTLQARLGVPGAHEVYLDKPGACRASESVVDETKAASGEAPLTFHSKPPPAGAALHPLLVGANTPSRAQFLVPGANLRACDPKSLIGRSLILVRLASLGRRTPGDVYLRVACAEVRR